MSESVKLFLSAVSSEFEPIRPLLVGDLSRPNLEVKEQKEVEKTVSGQTTLEKLDNYIRLCDGVIHLIGKSTGALPRETAVEALLTKYPDMPTRLKPLADQLSKPDPGFSYTQWEAYLALYHRKPLFIYVASDLNSPTPTISRSERFQYSPDEEKSQKEHFNRIRAMSHDRGAFSSEEDLRRAVLRDLVEILPRLQPTHKINNLPYKPLGELFVGRGEFIKKIKTALDKTQSENGPLAAAITTEASAAAVHGLGGIGKTRAAVEFAHLQADKYDALLFVRADSREGLKTNIAALCLVLDLAEKAATDLDVQFQAALRWLQNHPKWLLILDNVDSPEAVEAVNDLLGKLAHSGKKLITSRISRWHGSVVSLGLNVLDEEDAANYLLAATEQHRVELPNDPELAEKLAVTLGQLALALEQAAATINANVYSFEDYLVEWEESHVWAMEWFDEEVILYPLSVAKTWKTSFNQLTKPARELLNRLAWFSSDPIPRSLIGKEDRDALANLSKYSLVTLVAGSTTFAVHKLVQEVTRQTLPEEEKSAILTAALNWINDAFVGTPYDVRSWPTLTPLMPHALACVHFADESGIPEPTSRLMSDMAALYKTKAQFAQAEPLMRRALVIVEHHFGSDSPRVAIGLSVLADLLMATNRLSEAEPLVRRALTIDEASYGPDHPDVARDLNNLAQLLQATNRLSEAEPLMARVVSIFEKSYGESHPNVATALNNLAQLLQATNRLSEAEPLMRRALTIDEASYGQDHPDVARDLNNLAQLLQATNRLSEAEPLMRRALAIDEASYGPDHPNVAIRLNNLAQLLQATNRLSEAEPLMRRALAIDEASYGKDHPNVGLRLWALANLLQHTNRLADAVPLMSRSVGIYANFTRVNGYRHPHLEMAVDNFRSILKGLGLTKSETNEALRKIAPELSEP